MNSTSSFQGPRLSVEVLHSRTVTYVKGPTSVQVLLDIRPTTQNPSAPPLDLRFVIDRSGSMSNRSDNQLGLSKLDLVKQSLRDILNDLTPKDRLMIVSFCDQTSLDLRPTFMTDEGKKLVIAVIDLLTANGNTFISDALLEALKPEPVTGSETRVILFTDGESSYKDRDHEALVRLADDGIRAKGLCLHIYGTGTDYNASLLGQLAVRGGNGSSCKHVMEVETLREHLRGEIAFMRGIAIAKLVIKGTCQKGVRLHGVTRFMPSMHELLPDEKQLDHSTDRAFQDHSGSLDIARGQQYLINVIVDETFDGFQDLLTIELMGKTVDNGTSFRESIVIPATFTHDEQSATPPNERVMNVQLMIAAARLATQQKYDQAAAVSDKAGDHATATTMRRLHSMQTTGQRSAEDVSRTVGTLTGGSVSVAYTRPAGTKS